MAWAGPKEAAILPVAMPYGTYKYLIHVLGINFDQWDAARWGRERRFSKRGVALLAEGITAGRVRKVWQGAVSAPRGFGSPSASGFAWLTKLLASASGERDGRRQRHGHITMLEALGELCLSAPQAACGRVVTTTRTSTPRPCRPSPAPPASAGWPGCGGRRGSIGRGCARPARRTRCWRR